MTPPSAPSAPTAPSAPSQSATPVAPSAPAATSQPAAPKAPAAANAPETDAQQAQRLSGKHWQAIASRKWPESNLPEDLSEGFRPKAQAFLAILKQNSIVVELESTLRPA